MSIPVTLPSMGESVREGVVTRWLKKPGDAVRRDEPLYEVSTDKVDTEVPSPGSGRLSEIRVAEGQKAEVGSVVAVLEEAEAPPPPPPAAADEEGEVEVLPMSPMRARIARHMVESKRSAPHVTTVFEADLSGIVALRRESKEGFRARNGLELSYLPFFAVAVVRALRDLPVLNASVDGERLIYHKRVHLGIAVSLDEGLLVPVVRSAEEKSFLGLARGIRDVVERTRAKRLRPDEIQGGTFTLTNYGVFGGLFATPIIPRPQAAILGIGAIHERPVALRGAVALRRMCYLALSYDHRAVDGSTAARFLAKLKAALEGWSEPLP